MPLETFMYVATAGVVVVALSFALQTFVAIGLYRNMKAMRRKVGDLSERVEPVLSSAKLILEENRSKVAEISSHAVEIAFIARRQAEATEAFLSSTREWVQDKIEGLDGAIAQTMDHVQHTTATVTGTMLRPVREITGIAAGIKAGIAALARGQRASVERATQDEEMFI